MKWATRTECHVDRAACAWLIRKFIDADAEFVFVNDVEDVPPAATAFDIPGVDLSHHGANCTFETMLERYALTGQALQDLGRIVHEADLADERYDAPEAAGLDVIIRGMSMLYADAEMLDATGPLFDGLFEYRLRTNQLGAPPS